MPPTLASDGPKSAGCEESALAELPACCQTPPTSRAARMSLAELLVELSRQLTHGAPPMPVRLA